MSSQTLPEDDADDPIVSQHRLFLKPALEASRRLIVLQHPNKGTTNQPSTPTEVRLKPKTGMVEVDIPLDYMAGYDKIKGQNWGTTLAASTKAKAGGSHGLAGGFGIGAQQTRSAAAGKKAQSEAEAEAGLAWAEAVRQDKVLRTQTLGGLCPSSSLGEANWMVGVFSGGNIHLTPVASLVHLRPQLHHIDAVAEAERQKYRDSTAAAGGGPGGPGKEAPARAIHMMVKSTIDGGTDEVVTETMADRLRSVQAEQWKRFDYVDDTREAAYAAYEETLIVAAAAAAADDKKKDEEEKSIATSVGEVLQGGKPKKRTPGDEVDLGEKVSRLRTGWVENDMLHSISGADGTVLVKTEGTDAVNVEATGRPKGRQTGPAASGVGRRKSIASARGR